MSGILFFQEEMPKTGPGIPRFMAFNSTPMWSAEYHPPSLPPEMSHPDSQVVCSSDLTLTWWKGLCSVTELSPGDVAEILGHQAAPEPLKPEAFPAAVQGGRTGEMPHGRLRRWRQGLEPRSLGAARSWKGQGIECPLEPPEEGRPTTPRLSPGRLTRDP